MFTSQTFQLQTNKFHNVENLATLSSALGAVLVPKFVYHQGYAYRLYCGSKQLVVDGIVPFS